MTDQHAGQRSTREEAVRRMFDLPWRDMYAVWDVVGSYLMAANAGGESKEQKALRSRAEALDDLAAAARELGTAEGRWPKVEDYQRVAKQLGLTHSSQQIIRRWERWEDAGHALAGDRLSETPAQRTLRRATSGRRRNHEDRLAGMRDWLATQPSSRRKADYDVWMRSENHRRGPELLPYVAGSTIETACAVTWRWLLAVADHEVELPEAQATALDELTDAAGPLGRGCPESRRNLRWRSARPVRSRWERSGR